MNLYLTQEEEIAMLLLFNRARSNDLMPDGLDRIEEAVAYGDEN